jgi:predicted enzyme related to lactoylglutathione lyase
MREENAMEPVNAEPFKPGEFCWFNMLTPSPKEARAFFSKLLGWSYAEIPVVGGHMVEVGGRGAGALFDLASPQTPKGTPPLIGVMVRVESAHATAEKVKSLGGTASPVRDIMDIGAHGGLPRSQRGAVRRLGGEETGA